MFGFGLEGKADLTYPNLIYHILSLPGYPPPGYPPLGYPLSGYPLPGYPLPVYHLQGYPLPGYPLPGYPLCLPSGYPLGGMSFRSWQAFQKSISRFCPLWRLLPGDKTRQNHNTLLQDHGSAKILNLSKTNFLDYFKTKMKILKYTCLWCQVLQLPFFSAWEQKLEGYMEVLKWVLVHELGLILSNDFH